MNLSSFQQSKKDILFRPDKSFIFGIDVRIKKLCNKINSLENYYTTSSCSGRIVVMVEQKQKGPDLFLFVSHEKISFGELKKELEKIIDTSRPARDLAQDCIPAHPPPLALRLQDLSSRNHSLVQRENGINDNLLRDKYCSTNLSLEKRGDNKNFNKRDSTNYNKLKNDLVINSKINRVNANERAKLIKNSLIKLKFDPCILHIVCKDMKSADELLRKAQFCGWKKSGLLNFGKKIILELNSTERLEFPIVKNGKILVDEEFLKLIVEESNKKIELGWEKIKKLEKSL